MRRINHIVHGASVGCHFTRIGHYQIVELIGEGGFGSVYLARQHQPVRRDVALKIIKLGMDTRRVIARFEAERQALAILDHPNIAKVFDAGATDSGRPFFVMELVRGSSITQYCDEHNLTPRQRVELFIPACLAIQHAHHKGVIHRDLKPSNLLVANHDGQPVPKIIDFGIAKAVSQQSTQTTSLTELRQMLGTPAYMSPEQAGADANDADTRSDIYSLGVLLYELLTGTTPFALGRDGSKASDDIHRMIREVDPPKPSTRLATMTDGLATIAAYRSVEPTRLRRLVCGELDWIVMKCLEKDRARRYGAASELVDDLQRYLAGQTVLACPPSSAYRLRKFARRNRVAIVSTSVIFASLVTALVISLVSLHREHRDRLAAEQANRIAAEALASVTEIDTRHTETLLRDGYQRLLTLYGPDNPQTIAVGNNLAWAMLQAGHFDGAEPILRDTLSHARAALGPSDHTTILCMCHLILWFNEMQHHEEAVALARELFYAVKASDLEPGTVAELSDWWGGKLTLIGRYAQARQPLLDALDLMNSRGMSKHPKARKVMLMLAEGCDATGQPSEAALWRHRAESIDRANSSVTAVPPIPTSLPMIR